MRAMELAKPEFQFVAKSAPEGGQAAVAGCVENDLVEVQIEGGELSEGGRSAGLRDVLAQADLDCRNLFGCEFRGGGFKREAQEVEFLKIFHGERFDVGPSGLTELDQAFSFELEKCFTNGYAAYAEASSDGGFRKEITGSQVAEQDFRSKTMNSGVGERDRRSCGGHSVYRLME